MLATHYRAKAQQGFTLIELMLSLAILAILSAIAGPSFSTLIENNRIETQSSILFSALATARSEAVRLNSMVSMCTRNTNGDDCDTSADWSDGWLVFVDTDGDGALDSEAILQVFQPLARGITVDAIDGTGNLSNSVTYRPTGELTSSGGNWVICGQSADIDLGRQIFLNASGRPRRVKGVASCDRS